jgi:hypothetical protein
MVSEVQEDLLLACVLLLGLCLRDRERAQAHARATEEKEAREQKTLEHQHRRDAAITAQDEEREAAIKAQHWPRAIEAAVLAGTALIGMTTEHVAMAWGRPLRVTEEWVYEGARLHFVDEELVRVIQTSR